MRVFVSGGLDELDIDDLVRAGAPIDAFGVGTRMGVSADAPYLDSVYKLVSYGDRPVLKLSPAKITLPGPKQVFRAEGFAGDVVALRDEPAPAGSEPLLRRVMAGGRALAPPPVLADARERFRSDLAALPGHARDLREPRAVEVRVSPALERLAREVRRDLRARAADPA